MPFGDDSNDLPTHELQSSMNETLLLLIDPKSGRVPSLRPDAVLDLDKLEATYKNTDVDEGEAVNFEEAEDLMRTNTTILSGSATSPVLKSASPASEASHPAVFSTVTPASAATIKPVDIMADVAAQSSAGIQPAHPDASQAAPAPSDSRDVKVNVASDVVQPSASAAAPQVTTAELTAQQFLARASNKAPAPVTARAQTSPTEIGILSENIVELGRKLDLDAMQKRKVNEEVRNIPSRSGPEVVPEVEHVSPTPPGAQADESREENLMNQVKAKYNQVKAQAAQPSTKVPLFPLTSNVKPFQPDMGHGMQDTGHGVQHPFSAHWPLSTNHGIGYSGHQTRALGAQEAPTAVLPIQAEMQPTPQIIFPKAGNNARALATASANQWVSADVGLGVGSMGRYHADPLTQRQEHTGIYDSSREVASRELQELREIQVQLADLQAQLGNTSSLRQF